VIVPPSKKYQIEQMQGEKVVSRQRGFTVDSCVSAIAASEETPEFNGLAVREKVRVVRLALQEWLSLPPGSCNTPCVCTPCCMLSCVYCFTWRLLQDIPYSCRADIGQLCGWWSPHAC
jgi:hypothetical protein